jgi:RHS repeat-associated protein
MKKLYFTAILWIITFIAYTQRQTPKDTLIRNPTSAQSPNDHVPNLIPPAPNAAAMARHGEIPVSLSAGTTSFDVPIYEITSGSLKVPIKLSFHSSGVRANDVSSVVGTGWSLNAGGVITRAVKGNFPDECNTNIIPEETDIDGFACYVGQLNDGFVDGRNDDFFYNFLTSSGKFLFHNRSLTNQNITPVAVTYPYSTLKIERNGQNFQVTDNDGIVYKFEAREKTQVLAPASGFGCGTFTSSWFLTQIISANKIDVIDFVYSTPETDFGNTTYTTTLSKLEKPNSNPIYNYSYQIQQRTITTVNLEAIVFKNGKVTFDYVKDRQDQDSNDAKRLSKITVFQKTGNNTFQELKHFDLAQSYFACSDGNSNVDDPTFPIAHPASSYLRKRLRLDSVTELAPDTSALPPYAFEYYETQPLPIFGATGQDYWGFSNGANTNRNLLILDTDLTMTQPPSITYGANRTPDFDYAVSGALKKITYPTGGHTSLTYEPNTIILNNNSVEGGGIRIKKIVNNNASANVTQKSYNYTGAYFTGLYQGSMSSLAYNFSKSFWAFPLGCFHEPQTLTYYPENTPYSLGSNSGSSIAYQEVEEFQEDGLGNRLGKKVFTFRTATDQIAPNFNFLETSGAWQRGQPLTEKTYSKNTANSEVLIQEQTTQYSTNVQSNNKTRGYAVRLVFDDEEQPPGGCLIPLKQRYCDRYPVENLYNVIEFSEQSSAFLPIQIINTTYDQNGANPVLITTDNEFSLDNLQLTKSTTYRSNGDVVETINKYPHDFSGNAVYDEMVNRHIFSPTITTEQKEDGVSLKTTTVNYQQWYPYISFGGFNGFYAPETVQSQEGSGTLQTVVNFLDYDTRANLTKYSLRNGQTTVLDWYSTTDFGKTDLLKIHTLGGGTSGTVLQRSMSYDYLPLIGLNSMTDINGYTNTFQYDVFNRLLSAKDSQGYLLKDMYYHQIGETALTGLGITPTNSMNYIVSRVARTEQTGTSLSTDVDNTTTQIQYMDGLGRPLQAQIWQATPDKSKDIISNTSLYDAYGRAFKNILTTPSDVQTGAYSSTAETLAQTFYGDTSPSTESIFENSLLGRTLRQFGAGQAWRTADKAVEMQYLSQGNGIIYFDIQSNGTVDGSNSYPASSLFSNLTISERGFKTFEIKDKQGRVTHKFQELDAVKGFAVTAYVYDPLENRLRYVIPPEVYNKFGTGQGQISSFTENDAIFKEGIYGYHYDNVLGRQIEKHIPGAGWRYSVYDKHDREVMFADDEDKAKGYWQFVKYDALSRPIMTGLINNIGTSSRSQIQSDFDNFTGQSYETTSNGGLLGYTNVSFPNSYTPAESNVKSVTYYDDYAWQTETAYNFDATNAFHAQGLTQGLVTGTLVRNLETDAWYKFVNYYDYKGRIIQQFAQNNVGGIDRTDYQYRFNGEVLKMRMVHPKTGVADLTEVYEYTYDHVGRKTSFIHNGKLIAKYEYDEIGRLQTKKLQPAGSSLSSSQSGDWNINSTWQGGSIPTILDNVTISTGHTVTIPTGVSMGAGSLTDNGILRNFGTLNLGNLSPTNGGTDLYAQTFKYHIRGGLKAINTDVNNNLTNSLFSFKLGYEDAGFYDGNIGKQEWKSNLDNINRSFTYDYDGSSRIKSGLYAGGGSENYSLNNVDYDKNGNITNLSRNGWRSDNSFGLVDNLAYTYHANSNKIQKVDDASGETASFNDVAGNDYTYNLDGSLVSDANKGISVIEYNYLKLPKRIVKGSTVILNEYDAAGKKLKETIGSNTTDYVGNKIYKNGVLYQISHDEGRIIDGEYEYFINDHLGNLRVAFRDSLGVAKINQKQDYDPYGAELQKLSYLKSSWKQSDFKYSGKEFIEETGLNDFGWRPQDPILGRMWGSDRFAEKYYGLSNYQYGGNNPIINIDVNGDSLVLTGAGANDVISLINSASGGFYNATIDQKTGLVSYVKTTQKGTATKEQQAFIDNISVATDMNANTVKIEALKSSEDVPVGDFKNGRLDIDDINQFGNGPSLTAAGALTHEITEQTAKQLYNMPFSQTASQLGAHDNMANNSENAVNGTTKGLFKPRVISDPTKPHIQSGSWTQQVTSPTGTKNVTIMLQRNNVTKVYQ